MIIKALVTVAVAATGQAAYAQQMIPGIGVQLQQLPPPPVPEKATPDIVVERHAAPKVRDGGGPTFRLAELHIAGQTLYSEKELSAVAALPVGRDVTLDALRNGAARISDFYNAHGYFLARAYVPQQNIVGGSVTITILEGRYGKIAVRDQAHYARRQAEDMLSGLDSGDIVATAPLERRLLLLSDVPGVLVRSTLAPGTAVGTSDLIVDLAAAPRVSGDVEVDNAGNRYTGAYRVGGGINFNEPLGIGDALSVRLLASTGHLGYGRVAYQAPIGKLTVGVAYTHLHYALGREFKSLDADGTADIASLFASYPVIRSRDLNINALADVDIERLNDKTKLTDSRSRRDDGVLTLGFSGDSRDRSGSNSFSAGWSVGTLHFRDPLERALDALSAHSSGGFAKFQASFARLQTITGPLSLYVLVRGQAALDNLDSSQKMELGGAYGVRAYPEGEAYGDTGYIATAEAHLALGRLTAPLPGQFQLIGFVDNGQVRYAHNPWFSGSNHASRSGAGVGLNWAGPHGFGARVSYARRIGDERATSAPDKSGRTWFQVSKLF